MPNDCITHPYFGATDELVSVAQVSFVIAIPLIVFGGVLWIWMRWGACAIPVVGGMLILAVSYGFMLDPGFALRRYVGAEDLRRLQHELQVREADLERYAREHAGLSNKEIVNGFITSDQRPSRFEFSDPALPPVFLKYSDWRDEVPRVVVAFGCGHRILFDSLTMKIDQRAPPRKGGRYCIR